MAATAFKKVGVVIGCRDVVFAKVTKDDGTGVTYDTGLKSAPGVIEIALTAQTSSEELGADDAALYEVAQSNDGYEVSLTKASLSNEEKAFLLGATIDTKGALIESATDVAPEVAMGFKSARSDGSDDYVWLYKGKFGAGDETFHTKEKGKTNWQTPVLKGIFGPRISDGLIKAVLNTEDPLSASAVATFFDAPYTKGVGE